MILLVFAVYDSKAGFFEVPFFVQHKGQAIRAVIDLGSDLQSRIGRYPTDYSLFQIGTYDQDTGILFATAPDNLGVVQSFLPRQQSEFKLE
jgi:hypothetical protein